jgi:large subunit ribosomal protein L4
LKIEKTALLVEVPKHGNRNLELSSRNIAGTELVESNVVHPYHLLRYDHVIFTQPAIEKLQVSLTKSASRREHKPEAGEGEKKTARAPRRRTRHEKAAEVA